MSLSSSNHLHFWWRLACFGFLLLRSLSLNTDGTLLLSFKYSVLSDPLSVLESWNYDDETPCSWTGITCTEIGNSGTPDMFRVTSLVLPNSQLLGSVSSDLGMIEHLHHLDLSNNFLNGSLPLSLFNASELLVLSLSHNVISGELPSLIGGLTSLQYLNLSDNALGGKVPEDLTALANLTVVSLKSNYFSGNVPGGFRSVEILDLSSNMLNGSLPFDFNGGSLSYLNLSYNKLSGKISPEFAKGIPRNSTIDFSFNNLTGEIPESLLDQKKESFSGNEDLCGKPLKNLCSIPSTLSTPPNVTASPAIAVMPKTIDSFPVTSSPETPSGVQQQKQSGLKPSTIAGIAVGDLAGIGILAMIILYVYQLKKKRQNISTPPKKAEVFHSSPSVEPRGLWSCLVTIKEEETSESNSSETDQEEQKKKVNEINRGGGGSIVSVDGETKMELETLLKASAYILGTSCAGIVYKAVLEDGTALAVRRIAECGVERMKEFENQVRVIAKLRHPNLVRVRGFYWGVDEQLVIYDYVSNGSLATANYKKMSSPPTHLPLEARLKIARGVARGLIYIHEKKYVHGNIKPTNILLNSDTEPVISDLGLHRLVYGSDNSYKAEGLAFRHFSPNNTAAGNDNAGAGYHAPESFKNLKPNAKWDVYSFGIVLLELLTGKLFSDRELGKWTGAGAALEDKEWVLRLADVAIMGEVRGREDDLVACLRLGFNCAALVPQKRPSMKESLQVLEKVTSQTN